MSNSLIWEISQPQGEPMAGMNITRDEAQKRSATVAVTSYDISLDLSTRDETFRSETTVKFKAQSGSQSWIDFVAPSVESITLNGVAIDNSTHDGFRIALSDLAEENTLVVVGNCAYMNTGEGLGIPDHRIDVYLYHCNRCRTLLRSSR